MPNHQGGRKPSKSVTRHDKKLTKDSILLAAGELGSEVGFENFSMRQLAAKLNAATMSVYYYFPSKEALLSALVDKAFESFQAPDPSFGTWQDRLVEHARRIRTAFTHESGLGWLLINVGSASVGWKFVEQNMQILRDGGFSEREAVSAYGMLYWYGMGAMLVENEPGIGIGFRNMNEFPKEFRALAKMVKSITGNSREDPYRTLRFNALLVGIESLRGTLPDATK